MISGESAIIRIHNTGSVPVDIRETFFEKYSTSGKPGGTGLGTYSARLIAETLGGDIKLETSDETGTSITIELPKY
jgi:two-component system sensor histidine kinase/response regulator